MEAYNEFENTNSGASAFKKVSVGSLKKGELVMIKSKPCKITEFTTCKTGKHGAAKALLTGIDILTGRRLECTYSTGDTVDAPICTRKEIMLINIEDDGYVTLLLDSGELREDIKLPSEDCFKDAAVRCKQIFDAEEKECLVTVMETLGTQTIISCREGKEL